MRMEPESSHGRPVAVRVGLAKRHAHWRPCDADHCHGIDPAIATQVSARHNTLPIQVNNFIPEFLWVSLVFK